MKKGLLALLVSIGFLAGMSWGATEARFMKYPDIHGDTVVFTYEGDLWLVDAGGGTASRLTSFPGNEFAARFSPDGEWLAFTASYDGPQSVYRMPAGGGPPLRLTWCPDIGQTLGWTPDGERIFFRSMMDMFISRDPNLYFVSRDGSAPERFPVDRGVLASFSPDGRQMLYCRKGREEYQWKRYKGGDNQDIWRYDFGKNQFAPVSDYAGKSSYPMWVNDRMYFVSDRDTGIANLYVQDLSTKEIQPVTRYADLDVMMPETDGRRIVFLHDGFLHVLDLSTGQDRKLTVSVPSDRWQIRERLINPSEYIHAMDIAGDGKTVILEARGDVFRLSAEKDQPTVNLSQTPGTREMYPVVSPDGQWVAFFSDKTGEYQLYLQKVGGGDWVPLTTDLNRTSYHPVWSPDGKKILFGNKDFAIFIVDIATRERVKVDEYHQLKNDEFYWEISDYGWSPDSRWVCYSRVEANRNSRVMLYSLEQKTVTPVTDDFYDNLNPCFDANGDYLYFLSSQNFDVQMDFYEDNHVITTPYQIMVAQLRAGEKPPFWPGGGNSAPVKTPEEKTAPAATPPPAPVPLRIDLEGLAGRVSQLPVPAGNYFYLRAGKGMVAWCSVPKFTDGEYEEIFKPGGSTKWDLHLFDLGKKEQVDLPEKIGDFRISVSGEHLLIRQKDSFSVIPLAKAFESKKFGDTLDLSRLLYRVEPQAEWQQIFTDTWRWYRDFFYDTGMHGHDWPALGAKYRAYIPSLSSREELNWLMSQMVGELCVGHAYIGGGDQGPLKLPVPPVFPGRLGADLTPDRTAGYWRFQTIYGPTDYNRDMTAPLVRPDIWLQPGDYLLAIDGRPVTAADDYYRFLQVTKGQKVTITVNGSPTMENARTYEVEPVAGDRDLRYFTWLKGNVDKVLAATGGKVGYMHINAMNDRGIGEFDMFWRAFRYKDGIIIDMRRNSGGWTEYFLIDKLERQMAAYNNLRGMAPFRYPGSAGNGRYVAISNEYNGSDGEAFIEHFKARRLGKVVGVPSWGGLVGIVNAQPTIDNGSVNQPNNAFFGREGKWWVENHGADPDILVDNDPAAVMAGHDPQLEKAIQVILEEIAAAKPEFPEKPPYPKR